MSKTRRNDGRRRHEGRSPSIDYRRRAWIGAAVVVAIAGATLGPLVVRQVGRDTERFLDERRDALRGRAQLALRALGVASDGIVDEVESAFPEGVAALRGVAEKRSLVAAAFVVQTGEVVWPRRPGAGAEWSTKMWRQSADRPHVTRLFAALYTRLAAGDEDGALKSLEPILERSSATDVRVEALLQRAGLLAKKSNGHGATRQGAVAACDQVLVELEGDGDGGAIQPWAVTARLRRAELLEPIDPARAAEGLLTLAEELCDDAVWLAHGRFTRYYIDRVLERLAALESANRLVDETTDRRDRLVRRLARLDGEAALSRDLEEVWLDLLSGGAAREVGARDAAGSRATYRYERLRGAGHVIVWRHEWKQEPASSARTAGFLADAAPLREFLDATLAAFNVDGTGAAAARTRIVTTDELSAAGGDSAEDSSRRRIDVGLGGGLPWSVVSDIGAELDARRRHRVLLWGGLLALVLPAIFAVAWTVLRAMTRQLEAAAMKSQFVANVSHELKTPLTLIRMSSEMLELGYADDAEERQRSLAVIAREAETLGLLIDNILDLSRIDAGEKAYRPETVDMTALVRETVEEYRPYLENRGFRLELHVDGHDDATSADPRGFTARVDRIAFAQALRNLLSNAVKYSDERREVGVDVATGGDDVAISVRDRGVGFGGVDGQRLFERFYRGHQEGRRAVAGTGIGLAVVRHVVEAHGGRVEAAEREGGGSEFTMRFPTAAEEE